MLLILLLPLVSAVWVLWSGSAAQLFSISESKSLSLRNCGETFWHFSFSCLRGVTGCLPVLKHNTNWICFTCVWLDVCSEWLTEAAGQNEATVHLWDWCSQTSRCLVPPPTTPNHFGHIRRSDWLLIIRTHQRRGRPAAPLTRVQPPWLWPAELNSVRFHCIMLNSSFLPNFFHFVSHLISPSLPFKTVDFLVSQPFTFPPSPVILSATLLFYFVNRLFLSPFLLLSLSVHLRRSLRLFNLQPNTSPSLFYLL